MDLHTVERVVVARTRADLAELGPDTAPLAGGTWLFSEPQDHLRALVDLTGLGWPDVEVSHDGLTVAATCPVAVLAGLELPAGWAARPLLAQCCAAFLAPPKVQRSATVGGNLCMAYPAGPMISLAAALDGSVCLWCPDGGERRLPVTEFVLGDTRTALRAGEVVRSLALPAAALAARTAFRKIALSPLGRSGAVVIGRRDADGFHLAVSAATVRPVVLRWPAPPGPDLLASAVDGIDPDLWHDDAHGAADWRRAVTGVLAREVVAELSGGTAA
ncbi:FAD binding domain-containing protein [Nakamurella endophytica]|uniref:FAD binding domain-containing protein n=1 Tax=Nakamurella endophytica TaxID=1748367 RepID=UPI0016635385